MIRSHGTKSHMLGRKLHSGTSKTKQLVPVHLDLPYNVTESRLLQIHVLQHLVKKNDRWLSDTNRNQHPLKKSMRAQCRCSVVTWRDRREGPSFLWHFMHETLFLNSNKEEKKGHKMKANRNQTRVELTASKPETFFHHIQCAVLTCSQWLLLYINGHKVSQKEEGPLRLSLQVTTQVFVGWNMWQNQCTGVAQHEISNHVSQPSKQRAILVFKER